MARWGHKKCPTCNAEIPFDKRGNQYCSHRCAALNKEHYHLVKHCLQCGAIIEKKNNYYYRVRFCCIRCSRLYNNNKYVEAWLRGKINGMKGNRWMSLSGIIRGFLIRRCHNKCEKCGWSVINPKTGRVPLQINHIDGNWKNNAPNNLEVICPNCHSLTSTFGNLNRGYGRKEFRKKYDI